MSAKRRTGIPALLMAGSVLAAALISGGVAAATCPDTDPAAVAWLDKMSRSAHQTNYQGVVTLRRGDEMQVMQLSHSVGEEGASEHLTQLTGQGAKVVRNAHSLDCIHPGHKLLRMGEGLQDGHCGVAEHYRFQVADGDRIAGRKAVRIDVQPRDMYRYGYVLELDRETGLLLKARTVGRGEKILERFEFANLSYRGETPADVEGEQAEVVHQAAHPHPGVPSLADNMPTRDWAVSWVPGGFTPTDSPAGNSARRTYTDGLAVFSVFLEELNREIRPGEGVVRRGGTTSYTRGMQLSGGAVLITVIGEVPLNTARMVADSIDWTR